MVKLNEDDLGKLDFKERQSGEMNGFEALDKDNEQRPKQGVFKW